MGKRNPREQNSASPDVGTAEPRQNGVEKTLEALNKQGKSTAFWGKVYGFLATATAGIATAALLYFLTTTSSAIGELKSTPTDIKELRGQVENVGHQLARLDGLPADVQKLESLPERIASSEASLKGTAERLQKLEELPERVAIFEKSMEDAGKKLELAIVGLQKVEANFSQQQDALGKIQSQVVQLAADSRRPTSQIQMRLPLKEAVEKRRVGVNTVFVFKVALRAPTSEPIYDAMLQQFNLIGVDPADGEVSVEASIDGQNVIVTITTTNPDAIERKLAQAELLVAVSLFVY